MTAKKKQWYYANGYQLSQCKRLCEYLFGGFYFRAERDEENMLFKIYVFKTIKDNGKVLKIEDFVDIKRFEKEWCVNRGTGQWKLIQISEEDVHNLDSEEE